ncbi:MAG: sigma 54-interacting transcriptional regulator [Clostridia bacterium]|nr:sigma 54-interacting transcriptional regulator [Clostridia bacterium]
MKKNETLTSSFIDKFISDTSMEELMSILDYIQDAIIIDDGAGNTLWLNKSTEELYHVKREDILGKNVEELESSGIFSPSVAKLAMEKKKSVSILHSNVEGKKLLTTGTPIFDENKKIKKIISTSRDITELIQLKNRIEDVQTALDELKSQKRVFFGDIIANSPTMYNVIQLAKRLAQIDSTVLITGESGVGKGVVAKLLHETGKRKNHPFVKVNCGAIPDNLLESELFGYEPGAFTGSRKDGKKGLFEMAQDGTIFLDEIAELPLHLQVKILQVIQDKEIQRVGSVDTISVNVRIIAATNKDLQSMVNEGKFREDLYYRLYVVPINIPPLRERQEDIIPMVRHFLQKYNKKFNEKKRIDPNTIAMLIKYHWPGNVRELENIIERLIITTKGTIILPDNLPSYIFENTRSPGGEITLSPIMNLKKALDETEKQIIKNAAEKYKTTRQIAKALGVSQPTIVRKMQRYDIDAK